MALYSLQAPYISILLIFTSKKQRFSLSNASIKIHRDIHQLNLNEWFHSLENTEIGFIRIHTISARNILDPRSVQQKSKPQEKRQTAEWGQYNIWPPNRDLGQMKRPNIKCRKCQHSLHKSYTIFCHSISGFEGGEIRYTYESKHISVPNTE